MGVSDVIRQLAEGTGTSSDRWGPSCPSAQPSSVEGTVFHVGIPQLRGMLLVEQPPFGHHTNTLEVESCYESL